MENLAPFRQGHSGNPLNVISTSGRFRMDFFDDCGSHLEAQSIMDRPGWGRGGGDKNKDGGTTQTERLKIWAFLQLSHSQRRHNDHFYA